jgi:hypothetical protein
MTLDRVGNDNLRLTHEFLSVMLGVRRPTVTLIIGDLQKAGLIATQRGVIRVANRPGLEQTSYECYKTVRATFARLLPEMDPVS